MKRILKKENGTALALKQPNLNRKKLFMTRPIKVGVVGCGVLGDLTWFAIFALCQSAS